METFGYAGGHRHVLARRRRAHASACSCSRTSGSPSGSSSAAGRSGASWRSETASSGEGSCICLVATDAPLLPHQLRRLARRPFLGLARTGSYGSHGSGEIAFAWTTANLLPRDGDGRAARCACCATTSLSLLFAACAEAAEEAVLNALCAGRDLRGYDGQVLPRFPAERFAPT